MTQELRDGDKVDDPLLANPVTQAQPAKAVVSAKEFGITHYNTLEDLCEC